MDVLRVKASQKVVVHRRRMLFEFDVDFAEGSSVGIGFYIPVRNEDGTPLNVLTCRQEIIEIGDVLETGYEGVEEGEQVDGDVEITVAAHEHEFFTVYLTVPDDWGFDVQDPVEDQ